jgi:acyl carrier protein
MDQLEQKLINLIAEKSGMNTSQIALHSQLNVDVVLDSLSYAELLMDCEDAYKIDIPLEEAAHFKTVQDMVTYLRQKTAT